MARVAVGFLVLMGAASCQPQPPTEVCKAPSSTKEELREAYLGGSIDTSRCLLYGTGFDCIVEAARKRGIELPPGAVLR